MRNQKNKNLIAPEYLSPSSIGTYRQCPLKFKYSKIDKLPDPSGPEAILGNFVHAILEELYKLPQEFRTQQQAKEIAKELWLSEWNEKVNRVVHGETDLGGRLGGVLRICGCLKTRLLFLHQK